MRFFEKMRMRLRMLFRRREAVRLDEELAFHIEHQIEENIAAGMSAEEARYAALRAFGNPTVLRERARENWSWNQMESIFRDIRYGLRTLTRTPGFSLIVILVMALGTGATIAMFTVVHSVLLKPLPLPDIDRLVQAYEADTVLKFNDNWVAGGTFESWRDQNRTFEQLAVIDDNEYNLASSDGQLPERVRAEISSWQALPLLGVQPAYGRTFSADDDKYGAAETVILTWGFWQRRYGGDPGILGRTISLDDKPFTVIGILPAWFNYPDPRVQLWTPAYPEAPPQMMKEHGAHNFNVIGKLRRGVSLDAAQADLASISAEERRLHPEGPVFNSANLRPLLNAETHDFESALYMLFAATGCLLLIACLNIANLLVARSAARSRELAIRTALGGSRTRLLRERVTESVLLSFAGGVLGICFSEFALKWLVHLRPDLPRVEAIHLDGVAIAFAIGLSVLCGIGAGLAPALGEADQQLVRALQESSHAVGGSRRSIQLRRVLLAAEVALTVVLLVGAGLLLRSYQHLRATDVGIPTHNVLTMNIDLPDPKYKDGAAKIAFFSQLLNKVRALPGVKAAGISLVLPGAGHRTDHAITIHEDPPLPQGQWLDADVRWVDPGYFKAMQIPMLEGRAFADDEQLSRSYYAVVSQSFVRDIMHGRDPIGKHVDDVNTAQPGQPAGQTFDSNEIIGVVGDVRDEPDLAPRPTIYFPLYSGLASEVSLGVRTASDPMNFALPVQKIIAGLDSNLSVADILSLDEVIGKSTLSADFDATLLALFAGLSLVLAAVGLFGVLSYIVTQRQSEIGIRIALGAQRDHVLRLMLLDGLKPAILGLVLGLAISAGTTRLIASLLYGTQPLDVWVFVSVTAVLIAVAAFACFVPAWRASRLDPMQALRTE